MKYDDSSHTGQDALRLYVAQSRERLQQLLQRLQWTEQGVRQARTTTITNLSIANRVQQFNFTLRSCIARRHRRSSHHHMKKSHPLPSHSHPVALTPPGTVCSLRRHCSSNCWANSHQRQYKHLMICRQNTVHPRSCCSMSMCCSARHGSASASWRMPTSPSWWPTPRGSTRSSDAIARAS